MCCFRVVVVVLLSSDKGRGESPYQDCWQASLYNCGRDWKARFTQDSCLDSKFPHLLKILRTSDWCLVYEDFRKTCPSHKIILKWPTKSKHLPHTKLKQNRVPHANHDSSRALGAVKERRRSETSPFIMKKTEEDLSFRWWKSDKKYASVFVTYSHRLLWHGHLSCCRWKLSHWMPGKGPRPNASCLVADYHPYQAQPPAFDRLHRLWSLKSSKL